MSRSLILLFLAAVLAAGPLAAQERVRVKGVTDSGRLKTGWLSGVRLAGVVLPQGFMGGRPPEFFHDDALEALRSLVVGRTVLLEKVKEGRHTRAYVYLDSLSVNAWLLEKGYARWDGRKDQRRAAGFAALEGGARLAKRGLWISPYSGGATLPEYRYGRLFPAGLAPELNNH